MLHITKMDVQTAKNIRYVLMDIDDTITTHGKLPALAYAALWQLHEAGLVVIPITGRPAGWCDLIVRQWPVDGIVGENGALAFWEENGRVKRMYHDQAMQNDHATLQQITARVLSEIPESRIAGDQFARMFDVAFDFAEEEPRLPLPVVQHIKKICEEMGAIAKISSIHVNAWMGQYDKLSMTNQFLPERFGYNDPKEVLFFGDSPNDEPMFTHFPTTVGVANVVNYTQLMNCLPTYVTSKEGGEGFSEGVKVLLSLR